jgi:aspartyl aminopeptidase
MQGDKNVNLLDLENFQLRKKTDKASQAKLAANNAEIETIRNRYRAAMPSGGGAGARAATATGVDASNPLLN